MTQAGLDLKPKEFKDRSSSPNTPQQPAASALIYAAGKAMEGKKRYITTVWFFSAVISPFFLAI